MGDWVLGCAFWAGRRGEEWGGGRGGDLSPTGGDSGDFMCGGRCGGGEEEDVVVVVVVGYFTMMCGEGVRWDGSDEVSVHV